MGYGRFVGRVGALAVALGVGAAVASTPGIASAEPDSAPSTSDSASESNDTDSPESDASDTEAADPESSDDEENEEDDEVEEDPAPSDPGSSTETAPASDVSVNTEPLPTEPADPPAEIDDTSSEIVPPSVTVPEQPAVEHRPDNTTYRVAPAEVAFDTTAPQLSDTYVGRHRAPESLTNSVAAQDISVETPDLMSAGTDLSTTMSLESASIAPQVVPDDAPELVKNVFAALVAAAIGPLAGPGPLAPATSPALWTLVAAARREFQRWQRAFFNHTPDVRPQTVTVELDDPTDVSEEFTFDAVDRDGDDLTYHVPPRGEPGGPQHGTLTIDQETGQFTYNPDDDFAITGGTETIVVTVTDQRADQFHFHGLASLFGLTRPHRDSATVRIIVEPTAVTPTGPDASNDSYSTDEDSTLTVTPGTGVLANDTGVGDLSAEVAEGPSNGTLTLNDDGSFTYSPDANYYGSDSFTYTVNNGSGTDVATVSITVNPTDDPVTVVNDTATVNEDGTVTIEVLANDSVPDGVSTITVTHVDQGTATVVDGKIVYTPDPNTSGLHKFAYTVTDADGDTATAAVNVTVNPTDDPVTATDDTATVAEDGEVTINVAANDTAPDGGATVTIISAPTNGTATVSGTRVFYTPDPGTSGTDTFTYTLTDQDGDTATATVTVTVTAVDDDVVAEDDEVAVDEDGTVTIDVLANDSVDDGGATISIVNLVNGTVEVVNGQIVYTPVPNTSGTQTLIYQVTDADGDSDTATVTITINPTDDPVTAVTDAASTNENTAVTIDVLANDIAPDGGAEVISVSADPRQGTAVINTDGTITYTPNPNTVGPQRFAYTVQDANGDTSTAIVNITVTAVDDPVNANDDTAQVDEDGTVTIDVLANDSVPDGGATITDITLADTAQGDAQIVNGTIVYTPTANTSGTQTLTYTVTDADGDTDTATVTITVNPTDDPVTAVNDVVTTNEDTSVTLNVLANDTYIDGLGSVTIISQPSNGTATYNATTGVLTYKPNPNTNGEDTLVYRITDADGDYADATVVVTVNPMNDAVFAIDETATTNEDTAVTVNVLANDVVPDGGPTVTITPLPTTAKGTAVVNTDGTITFTPYANVNGTQTVNYTVTDADGSVDTGVLTITITPVDEPMTANADSATTDEDTPVTINVLANDSAPDGPPVVTAVSTDPNQGTAVINANGTITYTPKPNTFGAQKFTYTVVDADGDVSTAIVTVTVKAINDAPTADPSYGPADNYGAITGDLNASDVDNNNLSFDVLSEPSHGTLEFDEATGEFTYTPTLSQQLRARNTPVTDSFDVIVNDGNGGLTLVTVDIAVPPASATITDTIEIGEFSDPWGVVVHPTEPRAYVAVGATDSVEVIDTSTNEIIDTIQVGNVPVAVTMNADGSRLYVTNSTSRTVSVIDTATNQVIATVNTGTGPGRAIVAPNGYLYVANSGGAAVTVIDTATNTQVDLNPTQNGVQAIIPVGNGPRGLALSPDGSRLYVSSTNDDTVTVINTATNTVVDANGAAAGNAIATGGDQPVDAVMSSDGRYLYVSNQSDDYVTIIDTTDYSVEHVDVGGYQSNVALSPDGSVLYITMLSDETLLFDTATKEVIGSIDGEEGTRRIDVSPDGRYVYVVNASGTVSVITVAREGSAVI